MFLPPVRIHAIDLSAFHFLSFPPPQRCADGSQRVGVIGAEVKPDVNEAVSDHSAGHPSIRRQENIPDAFIQPAIFNGADFHHSALEKYPLIMREDVRRGAEQLVQFRDFYFGKVRVVVPGGFFFVPILNTLKGRNPYDANMLLS